MAKRYTRKQITATILTVFAVLCALTKGTMELMDVATKQDKLPPVKTVEIPSVGIVTEFDKAMLAVLSDLNRSIGGLEFQSKQAVQSIQSNNLRITAAVVRLDSMEVLLRGIRHDGLASCGYSVKQLAKSVEDD